MPTKKPRIYVVHLGCAKNQVDAENLVSEMLHAGFETCDTAAKADYILVNTCGFIEAAKEESINAILAQINGKKKKQKLIVSGCLSGRYGKELEKELPEVDYWVGTYKPGELLKKMGFVAPKGCEAENLARMNLGGFKHHAYLKIAEGCNRRCAYCAIPLIRGKQVSRPIEDIVAEAKELEKQGVKEITLIAQDTTYFGREKGKKGGTLAQLLKAILDNTNIPWIRTLYWYPMFVDDELLDLMANEPRLVKYVDMPIQHASDNVLKNMKRNYRKKELVDILHKIRERIPGVTLRTTVLVGFPVETDADFEELCRFVKEAEFDRLGAFTYSREEDTPAYELGDPIKASEKNKRVNEIMKLQEKISYEINQTRIGNTMKVLIDSEEPDCYIGRTEFDSPDVDNTVFLDKSQPLTVGEFYNVKITDAAEYDLFGTING